tara:strand:- start:70 stop:252 length:183 start_codon:yes stop_codon:yes gene_type:complete
VVIGLYNKQRNLIMPLINFTKEELHKIECYLLGEINDPIIDTILEKIDAVSNVCECNNQD